MPAADNPEARIPAAAPARRLVILGTGGTIAGRAQRPGDVHGYVAGQLDVAALVRDLPLPPSVRGLHVQCEDVAQVDSKDMTAALWVRLAQRVATLLDDATVAGIVVTHGTDTLEETAVFLDATLPAHKPVVLVAAMHPATALQPDGPQNLVDALVLAATGGARGVLAVLAGRAWSAARVRKVHPRRLDAFAGGDAGPLGAFVHGRFERWQPWPGVDGSAAAALQRPLATWPAVAVVTSHGGSDGSEVRMLRAAGVRAFAIAATGDGTVHDEIECALREGGDDVRVVVATRCIDGDAVAVPAGSAAQPVVDGGDAGGGAGAVGAIGVGAWRIVAGTPAQARVRLLVELASGARP